MHPISHPSLRSSEAALSLYRRTVARNCRVGRKFVHFLNFKNAGLFGEHERYIVILIK
jgi:hypothetical protein